MPFLIRRLMRASFGQLCLVGAVYMLGVVLLTASCVVAPLSPLRLWLLFAAILPFFVMNCAVMAWSLFGIGQTARGRVRRLLKMRHRKPLVGKEGSRLMWDHWIDGV